MDTRENQIQAEHTRNGHVDELIAQIHRTSSTEKQSRLLSQLIEFHSELPDDSVEVAREIRETFLYALQNGPGVLEKDELAQFLVDEIQPEDFAGIQWESPDQILTSCEAMYSFRFDDESATEQVSTHVNNLLRHALHHFEQRGEHEKMVKLLQIAPISPSVMDRELSRLRSRAYLYEMRRVRRKRHFLYTYLVLQVLLIVLVFPFLFIHAENGAIANTIEEKAEVDLSDEGERNRYFSYSDGLYWSLITAGSIGYGDITPETRIGKIIAATLGTMGVITVGVVAGLILNWITPRRLE